MKIISLGVKGFRSLRDISWNLSDLNLVIGPNGSGKSNLIQMLELISVSAQGRLGKYVKDLGGMESLLWDGSDKSIVFELKTSPVDYLIGGDVLETWDLIYSITIERIGSIGSYSISSECLYEYGDAEDDGEPIPFTYIARSEHFAGIADEQEKMLTIRKNIKEEEALLLTAATTYETFHPCFVPYHAHLSSWALYHDVDVRQEAPIRRAVVTRMERRVDSDGQNLVSVLHTLYSESRSFKTDIDDAMRAAFGNDYEELVFPPAADQRIQLRIRWKSLKRPVSIADLSDGTLRFLFLLTVLASPDPPPLIAIDEPETGLHPGMLSIIAEYAVEASKRTQIIFTTHSPPFLDAFTETPATTTVVLCPEGETRLKTLDGEALKKWLEAFSLGSLFLSGELEGME